MSDLSRRDAIISEVKRKLKETGPSAEHTADDVNSTLQADPHKAFDSEMFTVALTDSLELRLDCGLRERCVRWLDGWYWTN